MEKVKINNYDIASKIFGLRFKTEDNVPCQVRYSGHDRTLRALPNYLGNVEDDYSVIEYIRKYWNKADISMFNTCLSIHVKDRPIPLYEVGDYARTAYTMIDRGLISAT